MPLYTQKIMYCVYALQHCVVLAESDRPSHFSSSIIIASWYE